ncbi:Superfamily II DNA or RNA helicase [Anaerovibrio lipolyticus DSM 3074]|uniref:Superfamily II DNA or RNA helicase n=1 Tax=Anaerovibrio lipolyticus DSM 3074 TaxID=1120997 RepID=A0A1M6BWF6_9FIRM|nr:DEAD/DEAH box helicase family protein [Anaerovibrio lipolyticus]SHI52997.1 Superfamily II DNA or RNA helicase [Anaerovibrio lipolyticus DSM 3074]
MALSDIEVKTQYKSLYDDLVRSFYVPLLREGCIYRRAVGFFSSTALSLIVPGLVDFVKNNGKIEIIASPRLSEEDIKSMSEGYRKRKELVEEKLLACLEEKFDELSKNRLNLLANLIAHGVLDIKIATLKTPGIYHEKLGIIADDNGNTVVFTGSLNETKTAISYNYETIDVFCSWKPSDAVRVNEKINGFETMWNNEDPKLETVAFPKVNKAIIEKYKNTSYDEAIAIVEREQKVSHLSKDIQNKFVIPNDVQLFDYQKEAILSWKDNRFSGIFDMATGTGKTYTALGAAAYLSRFVEHLAVIIVCPFQHLVNQWSVDVEKFGVKPIIAYSESPQKDYKNRIKEDIFAYEMQVKKFICVVITNATFQSQFFQNKISKIAQMNCLLIVDEAHNFGAQYLKQTLSLKYTFRLALSATIERFNDPTGTEDIISFFGKKCIEYDLERAIKEDKLTSYYYYPVVVYLNSEELGKYKALSEKISRCIIHHRDGTSSLNDEGKKLLLKRARIVAGASEKAEKLLELVDRSYKECNDMLVYCGATTTNDTSLLDDEPEDDLRQIDYISRLLNFKLGMRTAQFTAKETSEERDDIIRDFEQQRLQALVAIKCLDEGVNIPQISTAFILASTTNPKEYIQRRGRVLRKAPGKRYATIYDFVTLPRPLDIVPMLGREEVSSDLSLVKKELNRINEFKRLAINDYDGDRLMSEIIDAYELYDYVAELEDRDIWME